MWRFLRGGNRKLNERSGAKVPKTGACSIPRRAAPESFGRKKLSKVHRPMDSPETAGQGRGTLHFGVQTERVRQQHA